MPRKRNPDISQQSILDFDSVVGSAEVLSREQVVAKSGQMDNHAEYSPIMQTAEYMKQAVQSEAAWEGTIKQACEYLLQMDARQLYLDFFTDIRNQINWGSVKSAKLADLLEKVAIRGFGMSKEHIKVDRPSRGATHWRVSINEPLLYNHLSNHIVDGTFLSEISVEENTWSQRVPLIGGSDVSQHRSAVPIPARFFKRSVPFVLNNAAGTFYSGIHNGKPKYENVYNPKPDETLLRWMLIDPSYQDELEPQDYERCVASAMDVGQYKFDLEYLMKTDKRTPDIIFRDGSIFPQDAFLDNYIVQSKRGEFTREAVKELLACLLYARELGIIYCGVTKNVQLKVYSAVVDWFIEKHIDANWEVGNYTLNDGQAMTLLLSSPEFVGSSLRRALVTCLIRRSFTTRANLNEKANLNDLSSYFRFYQDQHQEVDTNPFRRLCDIAHLYMFFIGHSKSPQQQLPRYEFFHTTTLGTEKESAKKILAALGHCVLMPDNDHSFMADAPVTYLIPSVTQQAHNLSKDVGKHIDSATGQWIMAQYKSLLEKTR